MFCGLKGKIIIDRKNDFRCSVCSCECIQSWAVAVTHEICIDFEFDANFLCTNHISQMKMKQQNQILEKNNKSNKKIEQINRKVEIFLLKKSRCFKHSY